MIFLKSCLLQTRRRERPRSSRDHHSNTIDVLYRFSTSMGVGRVGGVPRGAQGVPRGADEASPRGGADAYSGVPSMR